jgi:hypothetical protein
MLDQSRTPFWIGSSFNESMNNPKGAAGPEAKRSKNEVI